MKELTSTTKLVAVLAITVGLVVIGILNLRDRLSTPAVADDLIEWVDTADGVQAKCHLVPAHYGVAMHQEQLAVSFSDHDVIHGGKVFRAPHRHAFGLRQRIRLRTEGRDGQQG